MPSLANATPVTFVSVIDRERALAFYQKTLGLGLISSDEHGAFLSMSGALLRITPMPDFKASPHPVVGWDVNDIRASVQQLVSAGVEFAVYDGFDQDELGIWTSPDGATKLARFSDPDGNVLTLSQA
jgi:catechol 2,3-dioxygenase-like lactoylglutathione lyase family enzyme